MNAAAEVSENATRDRRVIDFLIRIFALGVLGYACLSILSPFLAPVIWGAVLAIAIEPVHGRLATTLGGRNRTAAALITGLALALLIVPAILLTVSAVRSGLELVAGIRDGDIAVPPPSEKVAEVPLIGEQLSETWQLAHENFALAVQKWGDEIAQAASTAASLLGSLLVQVAFFVISILLAGLFLAFSESSGKFMRQFARRLVPGNGDHLLDLSTATMRSVAKGVIGIAVIQALLAGLGLLVAGIPGAGLWALGVLVFATVQLPPLAILLPPIIWSFSLLGTVPAIVLTVYLVAVSVCDSVLKPLMLGRGLEVPMPVILIGAIGGLLAMGIIGLFTGAVILAVGHVLFMEWLFAEDGDENAAANEAPTPST
ncbi:MAG: AI-2E family transporter [Planctomycetota bacterium]